MSQKIINLLNSGDFRRHNVAFKMAVFETAVNANLITYDPIHNFLLHKGTILLGLLPDADGVFRFLRPQTEGLGDGQG